MAVQHRTLQPRPKLPDQEWFDERIFLARSLHQQWRICFRFERGDAFDVEIVEGRAQFAR
jgi:hypothetical protein